MIKTGQSVRLKNTTCIYTVRRLYVVDKGIKINDKPIDEEWAELRTKDGKSAFWKVQQLEPLKQ